MGAYLSKPVTDVKSDDLSKTGQYECGFSGMQGWRISMEDAHNCIPSLDDDTGLFSVYDGHGGGEVAMYCSHHFGEFLKERDSYQNGHYEKALIETFMHIDNILKEPHVIKELKILNQKDPWDPPLTEDDFRKYNEEQKEEESTEEDETKLLYEEATMNIEDLLAKYGQAVDKTQEVLDAKLNPGKSERNSKTRLKENSSVEISKTPPNTNENNSTGSSKVSNKIQQNKCGDTEKFETKEVIAENSSEKNKVVEAKDPVSKKAKFVKVKPSKMEKGEIEESDDDDYEDFESDEAQEGSSDEDDIDEEDLSEEEEEEEEEEGEDLPSATPEIGSGVEEPGSDSGTTAVVALLKGTQLYVANAGDSRCVLSRKGGVAFDMSDDHKPEDEKELNRIQVAGGHVNAQGRVNGGLNLSRAIGDHCYKTNKSLPLEEQMISAMPDVRNVKLEPGDEFMVLACDGICQQVVDFVRERLYNEDKTENDTTLSKICEELFNKCLAPDTMGDGTGCDNMTAMVIKFNQDWIQSNQTCANSATTEDISNGNANNNITDNCNNLKEQIGDNADSHIKEVVNKLGNNKRALDIDENLDQTQEKGTKNLPAKRLKVE